MIAQNKNSMIFIGSVMALLSVPLVAMMFSNEVNWSLFDFIVAGILLLGTGLLVNFVIQKTATKKHRFLFLIAIVAIFLLIWIELAIGIFGTPFAGS